LLLSGAQLDRIKKFREERIAKIIADETPVELEYELRIVVHIMPLSLSDPTIRYDLSEFPNSLSVYPINTNFMDRHRNFDGYLVYSKSSGRGMFGYMQFFRSGAVEAVDSDILRPRFGKTKKMIPSFVFRTEIVLRLTSFTMLDFFNYIDP
jgi:hypothetical protein